MFCPLSMETSDHVPCLVKIATDIPKGAVFRFENYWMEHPDFLRIVQHGWSIPTGVQDKAKNVSAKFKNLRRVLKAWYFTLSNLKITIGNVKMILSFLILLEEFRDLVVHVWNFRNTLM